MASRTIASCSTNAARISSGRSSHKRVEPSMSANRNVTVPVGGLPMSTASHDRAPTRGERTEALYLCVQVIDVNVEMHPVLAELRAAHALDVERRLAHVRTRSLPDTTKLQAPGTADACSGVVLSRRGPTYLGDVGRETRRRRLGVERGDGVALADRFGQQLPHQLRVPPAECPRQDSNLRPSD